MENYDTRRREIRRLRKQIRRRTQLFRPELGTSVVVGTLWQDFQDGPAKVRMIDSMTTDEQTTLMFCAPAGTEFPYHRHNETETILMVSKCSDDIAATINTEEGVFDLSYGDSIIIPAGQWHSGVWHANASVLLVFRPALPKTKTGEVVWNVQNKREPKQNGQSK